MERNTGAEIWRPLFDRYRDTHPDLPIVIVRVMLVRPRGMRQIFVDTGKIPALDELRADVATFLDLPRDARAALRRIRPQFFTGGRAIALLLSEVDEGLRAYDDPDLGRYYGDRVERFLARHVLPYRLDREPLKLTPLLHGEVDELYRTLRVRATADEKLSGGFVCIRKRLGAPFDRLEPDQCEGCNPHRFPVCGKRFGVCLERKRERFYSRSEQNADRQPLPQQRLCQYLRQSLHICQQLPKYPPFWERGLRLPRTSEGRYPSGSPGIRRAVWLPL